MSNQTMMTDQEIKEHVSANLRRFLNDQRITAYRLAKDIDEPLNTIYRVLRGENVAGAGLLSRIAEYLQVSVDDLLKPPEKSSKKSGKGS